MMHPWRTRRLLARLALALVIFKPIKIPSQTAGSDWPQFLGPTANGVSTERGLLDKWPAAGPLLVWEKKVGTGYSAPSVRSNRLVLHHRIGDEEMVSCFEAVTGHPVWNYAYPSHFVDPYGY